jgi:hypothetical protein
MMPNHHDILAPYLLKTYRLRQIGFELDFFYPREPRLKAHFAMCGQVLGASFADQRFQHFEGQEP